MRKRRCCVRRKYKIADSTLHHRIETNRLVLELQQLIPFFFNFLQFPTGPFDGMQQPRNLILQVVVNYFNRAEINSLVWEQHAKLRFRRRRWNVEGLQMCRRGGRFLILTFWIRREGTKIAGRMRLSVSNVFNPILYTYERIQESFNIPSLCRLRYIQSPPRLDIFYWRLR